MQSCRRGVERGSKMVLAVFPSAQFPGRQVLKMKRVCHPRRPRGQTGEKMTTMFYPLTLTSDWRVSSPYNNQHIVQQTGGRKRQIYQPDNII